MWGIDLEKDSELPIRRQIYQSLRNQIMNGTLKAGEPLPSTRELSAGLNVSRSTVSEAYEMLIAEGYAASRQGAPTRVGDGLVMKNMGTMPQHGEESKSQGYLADFRTGRPDLRCFPRYLWHQMIAAALEEMTPDLYGYTGAQGLPQLRQEIAAWLYRNRGLTVDSENIYITQGATHALHLVGGLLRDDPRDIIAEDPCHTGMLRTFLNHGCHVVPAPADAKGIQPELFKDIQSCGVYVTPSHQFPLGGILPASRRAALIRYARDKEAYIIEDDYDSEFRYCGEPVAPMYLMDPERVIYIGTFSKSVYPALRIGYVILPEQLKKPWVRIRTYTDVQNPVIEQAALAMFLRTRKLDRHVQKMRRIYSARRKILLDVLTREFGSGWSAMGDNAGLHLALSFPGLSFDDGFRKRGLEKGINITPLEYHCIVKGRHQDKLLLGYGHLEPDEIKKGVELLADHIRDLIL